MNKEILLRPYKSEDEEALMHIIREAWHYDDFASTKTASKLARIFLYSCLCNQTFTCAAIVGGEPVGVIMGKNIKTHKCPFKYRLKQITSIISLCLSPEGLRTVNMFRSISGIDNQLLNDCKKDYHGEIAFFAVSAKCRGMGIGQKLFDELLLHMRQEGIENFYLFTDTSCNFGFYEHQNMKRQGEKKTAFHINGQKAEMNFFIYDYQF